MGMNQTPSGERLHIGFFGKRNAGKSSIVNKVTGQDLAIVSEVKGTTTDPVYKSMELLPLGPVVIIDTPGLDDEGELGLLRVGKTRQVINKTDIAVVVADGREGAGKEENDLIEILKKKKIPYILVYNKKDLCPSGETTKKDGENILWVSAATGEGIYELKEAIGRLILPQQQAIRDILDRGAVSVVCQTEELKNVLSMLKTPPRLVVTDSQVFKKVDEITPPEIAMTSFSVLFARYKGNLWQAAEGAKALENIQDGDKILVSEGCTHHRQCGDIGTCKLPAMIRKYTGKEPEFVFTSGTEFPEDLSGFAMVIHCGGCMLTEREMKYRLATAADQNIPMTNYGIIIAYMNGILERSLKPLTQ